VKTMSDWMSSARFLQHEAARYDDEIGGGWPTGPTVRFLCELAGSPSTILEFGVGTGRVAVPLADAVGGTVTGVDNSPEMLEILAGKDVRGRVRGRRADMVDVDLGQRFDLVYCVFNTIYALPDQDAQVAFLANAARHLSGSGRLVVETQMIGLSDFVNNKILAPVLIEPERTELVMILHNPADQTLVRQTVNFRPDGVHLAPLRMRYVWPAELDLMARLAGLRLAQRFGGWSGEPFTGSGLCVSVYQHEPSPNGGRKW
jgi:SAM-dependent methyltransferase